MELDFEEISEEDYIKKKRRNKVISAILAVFLILILLVYLFPGDLLSLIEGQLVSSEIDEFKVEFQGGEVQFEQEVYDGLLEHYLENQRREIKACLLGTIDESTYYVTEVVFPEVRSASVTHILTDQCPKETIISLHSHPFKRCIFSEQDIKSYEHFKEINPEGIIGLLCEPERFSFYKD